MTRPGARTESLMPNDVLTRAIDAVASGTDLSAEQAQEVLAEIMAGEVGEAQTAAFLIALRAKGETVDELTGLARTMRELAVPVEVERDDLLDTAGHGRRRCRPSTSRRRPPSWRRAPDAASQSTATAPPPAGPARPTCSRRWARASTSMRRGVARCIDEVGFGFMFAPAHHTATRHVVPVRKELGVRTIFNFLGPLTNPAGATRQLIGVVDPAFMELIAGALERLGARHALVVSGSGRRRRAVDLRGDAGRRGQRARAHASYTVSPEDVGLERADHADLRGGDPEDNAAITRAILEGEQGPRRALVAFNAGAALMVAGRAETLEEGVRLAEQTLDSGAALQSMESFVSKTRELAPEEVGERAR